EGPVINRGDARIAPCIKFGQPASNSLQPAQIKLFEIVQENFLSFDPFVGSGLRIIAFHAERPDDPAVLRCLSIVVPVSLWRKGLALNRTDRHALNEESLEEEEERHDRQHHQY